MSLLSSTPLAPPLARLARPQPAWVGGVRVRHRRCSNACFLPLCCGAPLVPFCPSPFPPASFRGSEPFGLAACNLQTVLRRPRATAVHLNLAAMLLVHHECPPSPLWPGAVQLLLPAKSPAAALHLQCMQSMQSAPAVPPSPTNTNHTRPVLTRPPPRRSHYALLLPLSSWHVAEADRAQI